MENKIIIKKQNDNIYVKSNKKYKKKIELKNLDIIKKNEEFGYFDEWTQKKINEIKNQTFKNNVIDIENNKIVSSVRLVKINKYGKNTTPLIWEYYKNRGNLDINMIIKQYRKINLIINYSNSPNHNKILENNINN
jgi:hypothetical protein